MSTGPDVDPVVAVGPRRTTSVHPDLVQVLMTEEARDVIDAHVAEDTSAESGGILAGSYDERTHRVRVIAAVPARLAVGAVSNLTFTHEAWDEVNAVLAAEHPDLRMVGWYHSHPHFGIFLSEYDLFIHRNFFAEPWQVAYVVDPLLGQAGYFGWRDGAIEQHGSWLVRARTSARAVAPRATAVGGDAPPSPQRGPALPRPTCVGLGLLMALLAFAVGYVVHRPSAAASVRTTRSFSLGSLHGTRTLILDGASGELQVVVTNIGHERSPAGTVDDCAPAALTTTGASRAATRPGPDGGAECVLAPLGPGRAETFDFHGPAQAAAQALAASSPAITFAIPTATVET